MSKVGKIKNLEVRLHKLESNSKENANIQRKIKRKIETLKAS